jgi:hypothetical protein
MASKLKVTWISKWSRGEEEKVESAEIPADGLMVAIVGETLVFRAYGTDPGGAVNGPVLLIVAENRVISAVPVED